MSIAEDYMPDAQVPEGARVFSVPTLTLRIGRSLLPLVLLGIAVHVILLHLPELRHSWQVVHSMALWAVGLAIVAQILSYVGSGYLLRTLVAVAGQQLSIGVGVVVTLAASSVGLFSGGVVGNAAATYRWLYRRGIRREGSLLAGWLPSFFNNAALVVVGVVGVAHLVAIHELSTLQAIGFGVTLVMLGGALAVVLWGMYQRPRFTALVAGMAKRWARLRRRSYDPAAAEAAAGRVFVTWDIMYRGGWRGPALGALLNVGFDALTLYLLFVAAGHPVSLGVLLTGYGLPQLLSKISFLPGGVGIVEATMAALYNGMGVPGAVTVVVVLAYRALSFWLPTLLGLPLTGYLQHAMR
jgi:uncharacterized membrane protein YbhN (UPF0104 family)